MRNSLVIIDLDDTIWNWSEEFIKFFVNTFRYQDFFTREEMYELSNQEILIHMHTQHEDELQELVYDFNTSGEFSMGVELYHDAFDVLLLLNHKCKEIIFLTACGKDRWIDKARRFALGRLLHSSKFNYNLIYMENHEPKNYWIDILAPHTSLYIDDRLDNVLYFNEVKGNKKQAFYHDQTKQHKAVTDVIKTRTWNDIKNRIKFL